MDWIQITAERGATIFWDIDNDHNRLAKMSSVTQITRDQRPAWIPDTKAHLLCRQCVVFCLRSPFNQLTDKSKIVSNTKTFERCTVFLGLTSGNVPSRPSES